ncbi:MULTISPECIES: urea ABC transporter substrate-binding protein [Sulfitobacter]|jgi:urea transport system substrate-binding protein|uniref:Urea ABC transporter substrate-binding protein n=3 Tax=Alphaproteobacteria TaxID=28211 RepID=A0ABW1YZB8_9RHOB|nr:MULTISPECIES: urea ABC transporter substrate-binding protein [Sulfitobacter]AYE85115.1 urea ABC transporter substrate-binding protein [Sulfitobacter sp. D7]KZX95857.1 urea ABC transporter substrate-binding protein [Sulfitobacter sp. HI0027]KZX98691.1 urea ABC transporter substrate-binding protein [Sulfitobacter sp. HI0021]KZY98069.1 urea ABC transporter substrate-binding protein [Sulfitobacter sp. HI0076]MAP15418.1 urea ABC transporter substrate-binding protein [Sulfitobacter sp.]|tara:strand:+ start:496 stop:1782 length:1287 start_codon:yes stop_codon:yes gene_type:complete
MRLSTKRTLTATAALLIAGSAASAECEDPIKVGVLHSLSGTMAISETTLKDTMELLITQQNAAGGLLDCEIEAVVVDPASDWPLFAEKARELLTVSEVDVIFGSWTSVSRKSALPVLEELNGLMFYPVQYEGEESSRNVFYTGAAPNQQAIPATDYFLEELGVEKFALLGTDYVYPRTTNNILEQYLLDKGIPKENIFVNYTPFGHSDWSTIVADVVELGADGSQVGVISTINGDANIGFYKELAAAGISADDIPVVAFSVGEEELSGLDTADLVGHLAAWNYFQSAESDANDEWVAAWKEAMGEDRVTNDPMEAHYIGFNMWVNAVTEAGTTDVDAVRAAMYGQEFPNLTGGTAVMLPNHHLAKPVLIGEITSDGQFDIISQTEEVPGDAWTDFLPESAVLVSDWKELECGMYNTETKTCVQLTSNY